MRGLLGSLIVLQYAPFDGSDEFIPRCHRPGGAGASQQG